MELSTGGSCQVVRLMVDCTLVTTCILLWFSTLSFFAFGSACFGSGYMRGEFARYGCARQLHLVGVLQLLGACGLLSGMKLPWLGQLAAACLALLMLLGVGVRIKIKDTLVQTLPALGYLALNAYLCFAAF